MPSSAIVAARKFVRDGLEALLSDAEVSYSWDPSSRAQYQVFTMRARGDHEPAALKAGKTIRDETARFNIAIHVAEVGGNVEEADDTAIEFGRIVEDFIATNRCPPVDGINWWVVESWEMDGGPSDNAAITQLIYTIRYNARLT